MSAEEQLALDRERPAQLTLDELGAGGLAASPPRRVAATELTPAQREAVERRDHSLLLTATAGSGKTRVLVERFVCAVLEDGIAPDRILAITFTEKAAQELRARIRARFTELGERDAARDAEAAFVTTIHGFCARLLRTHPLAAGLDPDFGVCDDAAARRLRRQAFDVALRRFMAGEAGVGADRALEVVASFGLRRIETAIDTVAERLRSRGEREPRLPMPRPRLIPEAAAASEDRNGTAPADTAAEADAVALAPELDALLRARGDAYRALKRARNLLDFDDLELEALELLRGQSALASSWAERFELLMIDEFQDTNPRQAALLGQLERDNLFVVGDEFQSIYGFRFADPQLLRARRDTLAREGATIALAENFRSRAEILDAVNAAFAPRFGERFVRLVAARDDAGGEAGATGAPAAEPRVELLLTDCGGWTSDDLGPGATGGAASWRRAEARALARRLAELVRTGRAQPGETILLLRAGTSMAIFERALLAEGLRTLAIGGGFWEALEVSDLVAYLRALANPQDTEAFYTLLASPLVGVGVDALALIGTAARAAGHGDDGHRLLRAALGDGEGDGDERAAAGLETLAARDRELLAAFVPAFEHERRLAPRLRLDQLLTRVLDASGYRELLRADAAAERRLANVQKLLRLARRQEAAEGRDLRGFIDYVEAQRAIAVREPEAPIDSEDSDAVRLMTIHSAKGLEADTVCVADLGRLRNSPDKPYVLADGERLGICVPRPDGSFADALDYAQLRGELREAEAAEEDRVLYVAMTRARERLLLSGSVDVERWPRESRTSPPLAWLGPALVPDIAARLEPLAGGGHAVVETDELRLRLERESPPTKRGSAQTETGAQPQPPAQPAHPPHPPPSAPPSRPWGPLARAPAPSTAPVALSYSALSDYAACGYRYYLQRVLGLPETKAGARNVPTGPRDALDARTRGTIVHALLEELDFDAPAPPSDDAIRAAAARAGVATLAAAQLEQLRILVAAFARSPLCARLAAGEGLRREQQFAFVLGEGAAAPLVNGFLDACAREPDGSLLIVDYKTDATDDADLEQLTEADYGAQRLAYALAGLEAGATEVEVAHCYLERPAELVAARYTSAQRDELRTRLEALAGGIYEGRFEVSPRPHRQLCEGCPGRAALCSWDLERTGSELTDAASSALAPPASSRARVGQTEADG